MLDPDHFQAKLSYFQENFQYQQVWGNSRRLDAFRIVAETIPPHNHRRLQKTVQKNATGKWCNLTPTIPVS
jgi:hypothetical protein